jgi:hypothetical protein
MLFGAHTKKYPLDMLGRERGWTWYGEGGDGYGKGGRGGGYEMVGKEVEMVGWGREDMVGWGGGRKGRLGKGGIW